MSDGAASEGAARSAWVQQGVWSETANRLKRELTNSRRWVLGLIIAGAVLETVAAQLGPFPRAPAWLAPTAGTLGAAALAAAVFLRAQQLGADRVRDWLRARSASEALKEAVYLDAAGVLDEPMAAASGRILDKVADLEPRAAAVRAPIREPPGRLSVEDYIRVRVDGQIAGYYRRRAEELARRLALVRRFELLALLAGVVMGVLAPLVAPGVASWVAVLTTIASAVVAETEATRYQYLIISYRTTARRLEALRDGWRARSPEQVSSPGAVATFIRSCEDAISAENESWMAEWVKETV